MMLMRFIRTNPLVVIPVVMLLSLTFSPGSKLSTKFVSTITKAAWGIDQSLNITTSITALDCAKTDFVEICTVVRGFVVKLSSVQGALIIVLCTSLFVWLSGRKLSWLFLVVYIGWSRNLTTGIDLIRLTGPLLIYSQYGYKPHPGPTGIVIWIAYMSVLVWMYGR